MTTVGEHTIQHAIQDNYSAPKPPSTPQRKANIRGAKGIVSASWVTHLQQQSTIVLDCQRIALTGLHFGINGLPKCRPDTLCFSVRHILDQTPQVAPYTLLSAAVEVLTDIGLWDTVI